MNNYQAWKDERFKDESSEPGSDCTPFEATVMSIFGEDSETWHSPLTEAKGFPAGAVKLAQASKFLEVLFGKYTSGFAECRTWAPDQKFPTQRFFDITKPGWVAAFVSFAFQEEFKGKHVFVGVLPRATEVGRNDACKEAICFWADIDFKTTTAQEAKKRGAGEADLIVQSGGGLHCYFLFEKPVPITGDFGDKFKSMLIKKQDFLGADRLPDFSRILRLPGTTNFKPERAVAGVAPAVKLVQWPGKERKEKKVYEQGKLLDLKTNETKPSEF